MAQAHSYGYCLQSTVESRFNKPSIFEPLVNSNQNSFLSQPSTVTLHPISRTIRFFEPIFVSLGGSKNQDCTVLFHRFQTIFNQIKTEQSAAVGTNRQMQSNTAENLRLLNGKKDPAQSWAHMACSHLSYLSNGTSLLAALTCPCKNQVGWPFWCPYRNVEFFCI